MKIITKQEFINMINDTKGATIVAIDIASEPKMRKTDNPYMGTTKVTTLSGIINFDYETSVNNQLEREGKVRTFEAKPRAWGVHENNWITHNGNYYLPIKVQGSSEPVFKYNGVELAREAVEPFLYESRKPHTQEDVDKEVVVRDLKIDSIKVVRAFGEEFVIA